LLLCHSFRRIPLPARSKLFPYTTLFRSDRQATAKAIINFLIKTRAGRVTILPLDTLSHRRPLNIWPQLTGLPGFLGRATELIKLDRKSTRLNSSHVSISYAVFCLKKKKT